MRIEVVETLSALERKRWEFVCVLDSRGIHIRLASMHMERRENMNKRSPFNPVLIWHDTSVMRDRIPHTLRMHNTPKVPLGVQRTMRKHLEATIHYNFEVCMAHAMIEAAPGQH